MTSRLDFVLRDLPAPPRHRAPYLPPPHSAVYALSSSHHPFNWQPQAHHSALFAGPLAPSSWTNAPSVPTSLWPAGPPDFLLPFHRYPSKPYDTSAGFSVARSDTSSAISRDSDLSPSPEIAEVVCNAPLVAPVPLPYHSPTFLMYDLPDEDEDLSHPPYTHRPHKRKRARDEREDSEDVSESESDPRRDPLQAAKRRALGAPPRWEADGQWEWMSTATAGSAAAGATPRHHAPAAAAAFSRRNRAR
ncbi:hypothetical protein C2E23DRAFT_884207 [Lenzites betulinus]|nr:hypothetical protein C2E23DRAFT_884207 [Lenzites betulinus]